MSVRPVALPTNPVGVHGGAALRVRLVGLALALAACGREAPSPRWIDLAREFRPRARAELAQALEAALAVPRQGRVLPPAHEEGEPWFELPLPRALWQPVGPGDWTCPIPTGGALLAAELGRLELLDGPTLLARSGANRLPPGHFDVDEGRLRLALAEGERPDAIGLRVPLDLGHLEDGVARVAQRDLACDGLLVFPGTPERLTFEAPDDVRLGFATVAPDPGLHGETPEATLFRVRSNGRVLFERLCAPASPARDEWNWVELDGNPGPRELAFEVEGSSPARFATPLLAPRDIGIPGRRPWEETRPDIVLVLCDTFRADSLEAWGGPTSLAPRLNQLVSRSLRFLDARAVAAWTLPSIGTLLSGVFPAQHGAVDLDTGLAPAVETIAEVLARAGYRTAAITDSGLFSRHYRQDQGFEWFQETSHSSWSLAGTLARARARMAADDGRPLFLVVHTYRVHAPLRVGPEEDPEPAMELLRAAHTRLAERRRRGETTTLLEVALGFQAEAAALYRDAVADLDRKLGGWIEELERDGFFARGVLVLTSDHGEALGEHGQIGHGGDLYDVRLRVPLAIAGHGIEPGAVPGPVSLVDLAPTLAELAGVAPSPTWIGRSLLGRAPSETAFAFDLKRTHRQVALITAGKKLLARDLEALRDGRPSHAFDLAADPAEETNLAEHQPWPGEISRSFAEALAPFLELPERGPELELSPELRAQLEAIGYGE